jgi:signal transduction histidine kinase
VTWPWQKSIQARIVLILVGLLSAVLLFVNLQMGRLLASAQLEETANHLQIQALLAANSLEDPLSVYGHELEEHERHEDDDDDDDDDEHHEHPQEGKGGGQSHLPRWAEKYAKETGARITVTDGKGRTVVGDPSQLTEGELNSARDGQPFHRWTSRTIFATAPILQRERLLGVVRLAIPRAEAGARSRRLSLYLALASILALTLAWIAASLLSRRLVRPLKQLEQNAVRASKGEWDQAVSVEGQDELAALSRAFATMLSDLQKNFEQQRRFVVNASHELRTPLTRLKLRTEALVDGGLEDPNIAHKFVVEIDGEVDRLTRLTNSLLDLARLKERPGSGKTDDPAKVLQEFVARLNQGDRKLTLTAPDSLPPIRISPENLELVIGNLVDNAFKYSPPDTEVRMLTERTDSGVRIVVEDEGSGVSAEHLPHLFERFYRADPVRTKGGTGLGLALVKAAVLSAGGSVRAESEVNRGSRFVVEFPRFS